MEPGEQTDGVDGCGWGHGEKLSRRRDLWACRASILRRTCGPGMTTHMHRRARMNQKEQPVLEGLQKTRGHLKKEGRDQRATPGWPSTRRAW